MAKITNNLLIAIIIALVTWSWVTYITNWQLIAILASIAVTALFLLLASKSPTCKSTPKQTDSLTAHIALSTDGTQLIDDMLRYYLYSTHTIDAHHILASKEHLQHMVYCHNSIDKVTADNAVQLAHLCQQHAVDNVTIVAPDIDTKAYTLLSYCNITVKHIDMSSLYDQLQHANMLPQLNRCTTKTKGIVASYALQRNRSKHYAISAIFLIVISRMSYIPVYTLIWATILLILALYSRFNTRYNKKISHNLQL